MGRPRAGIKLYHIELETHDILIANDAPAESYRDDGTRWIFLNANTASNLPQLEPYAPILTGGPIVNAVWRRLLDRARPKPGSPLTDDADLHLLVDGQRVDVKTGYGEMHRFRLPVQPGSVRIVSRAAAPQELGVARDPRVIGVAVRQVMVTQDRRLKLIEADDPSLVDGFHGFEPDNGFRWTNGDAAVPMALFEGLDGPIELYLRVGMTALYAAEG